MAVSLAIAVATTRWEVSAELLEVDALAAFPSSTLPLYES